MVYADFREYTWGVPMGWTQAAWDWLKRNSDQLSSLGAIIGIVGAIIGIVLFLITIYQLNETRKVLEAQTLASSLSDGRDLLSDLTDDPDLAEKMFQIHKDALSGTIFVQKMMSLFSEQQIYFASGMIDKRYWEKIRRDLCEFSTQTATKPIVESLLKRDVYPPDFTTTVELCLK